jgi:2,4-dienoyl-CoA reductase-like NADH-dependent reductase (Old Yellow Enzyme family)/thioredoxin reductase
MSAYPHLFSPGRIGPLTAKNRLVMAPMVRNYAAEDGTSTPRYLAHLRSIAEGGVGTLILEAMYVTMDGRGFPGQLGLHGDHVVDGLRELVEVAHANDALIGPQLYHAGRQTSSAATGTAPVAPSPIPDPLMGEVPRELTVEEIRGLVDAFGAAARRAKDAGCDFVQIHGAHGYLVTQFLSPFTNKRDDEYGGGLQERMRFLKEIVASVRENTDERFPILVRLSGDELVPGGLTLDDTVAIASMLEQAGVDVLDISAGNYASYTRGYLIAPMVRDDGLLVEFAEKVKNTVSLPVITVGKIRTPELAERIVADGRADLVALGRQLLADPAWPAKAEAGRADLINHCIACNQACIGRLFAGEDVRCTVNPVCGFEEDFARPAPSEPKRVLVVGGGPGGMQAAVTAAQRGHQVVLCEQQQQLGGQLIAAAATPHRQGWEELRRYLEGELQRLEVDVRLGTEVNADLVGQLQPDTVVVATGSRQIRPNIPGIDDDRVITSRDLLEGRAGAEGHVVVAGGGCAGAQTAEHLAVHGHPVTLVEQFGDIAADAPLDDRSLLIGRLGELEVDVRTNTTLMRVDPQTVTLEDAGGPSDLECGTVVVCLGAEPQTGLVDELRKRGVEVVTVGDVVEPRKVTEAIHEGAQAALAL